VHPTRDFSYVSDTVAGFIACLESDKSVGQTINVGSGFEITVGETALLIARLMGTEIEIETDDQRMRPVNSEVERLLCDNSKARELMGWQPRLAGIEGLGRGLTETIAWFSDPANLARYKTGIYNL
jgi:dTDP-glucose 4,6-dehydratase